MNTPPRRRLARQAGLTLFASLLLLGGSVLSSVSWLGSAPAGASSAPPWEPDPDSVGGLVFYNSSGQVVTGGNITDSPIAAYVQGSSTVRTGDTVATLYGYLPVNGQPTSEWSGEQLGLTTIFPNPSAPAPLNASPLPLETGNSGDETLQTLEADFPNNDHSNDGYAGMYQLRLYTNAPHKTQTTVYDSADILISGSTWSVVFPQSATPTTTTLTASPAGPQPFGTQETLTATVSPSAATGTVQFEVNGTDIGSPVTVSGGTAQKQTSTLPVGTDNLSAVFTPTTGNDFSASTGTATFTVDPVKTTTSLSVSPPSPQPGGTQETLTATISPSAAPGTVQFEVNGTDIGSPVTVSAGTAQTQTSSLPSGTDSLSAVFTPSSSDYAGSTGTASFTVTAAATQTTLTVTPASPQQFGTNETLTATISPSTATGTVQFEDNGTNIGSAVTVSGGTAHTQTSTLPVGTDPLSAVFTPTIGNGFSSSTGTASFTVNPITTNTSLAVSPASPQFAGTPETLTATISPSAAPGTVQFEVNGNDIGSAVTVSAGTAHTQTSTLPVGTDSLSAVFTATTGSGYNGSTGTASFTVNQVTSTTTALSASPTSPQQFGTPETLTATISPSAAPGTVQFEVNGTDIGSPVTVSGGTAQTQSSTLPVGTDNLSAVFTPTTGSGFGGSTGTASFTVNPITTTTALAASPASPQFAGTPETLTATISPSAAPGTVQFEVNGADIGSPVTVSGGTAQTTTSTLPVGTDSLSAVFTPTTGSGYNGSTGTAPFTVNQVTSTTTSLSASPDSPQFIGTNVTLTATISPSAAPGTVQFVVNGINIGNPLTVSDGTAQLQTSNRCLPATTNSRRNSWRNRAAGSPHQPGRCPTR